jgi:hypothetical protein
MIPTLQRPRWSVLRGGDPSTETVGPLRPVDDSCFVRAVGEPCERPAASRALRHFARVHGPKHFFDLSHIQPSATRLVNRPGESAGNVVWRSRKNGASFAARPRVQYDDWRKAWFLTAFSRRLRRAVAAD